MACLPMTGTSEARQCFADTDTLHIEFRASTVSETRDLDENTVLDVDSQGNICAITVEHASERAGIPDFSCEQVAAQAAFTS